MNRPTKEELEANLKKTQEELEKLKTNPQPSPSAPQPSPSAPQPSPSTPQASPSPSHAQASPSQPQASPSPSHAQPSPSPSKPDDKDKNKGDVDWEKRYKDSTRGGQQLYEQNQSYRDAIKKGNELPTPTDEEMKKIYPEWDKMDVTMKQLVVDNFLNKQRNKLLVDAMKKVDSTRDWVRKVVLFTKNPKTLTDFPEVDGKEEEFIKYAEDKEGVTTDFKYLLAMFIRERKLPPKKKGQMFPNGSGGANDRGTHQKPGMISYEQSLILKKTNFKAWKKALLEKRIENPMTDAKK